MAGGGGWLENLEIMLTQFNCNCLLELSLAKGRLFEKGRRAGEGRGCSTVQGHQGGRGGQGRGSQEGRQGGGGIVMEEGGVPRTCHTGVGGRD